MTYNSISLIFCFFFSQTSNNTTATVVVGTGHLIQHRLRHVKLNHWYDTSVCLENAFFLWSPFCCVKLCENKSNFCLQSVQVRLAEARARLELRESVTADDAHDVVELMKSSMMDIFTDDLGGINVQRSQNGSGMSKSRFSSFGLALACGGVVVLC